MIRYTVRPALDRSPGTGHVKLTIHDLLGREVAVLVDGWQTPGTYSMRFDADRTSGISGGLSTGVYYLRPSTGPVVLVRRMLLQH